MACAVSAVSRAAPHIRACLHSTGLLQSLTAGKTSPLLWARSQEKATSPSLSQRETYSDRLSPTAAESNNRLVKENWTEDDRRQIVGWKKVHIFSKRKAWERGSLSLCFSNKVWVSGMQTPSRGEGQVYWALDDIKKAARVACVANRRSDSSMTVFIRYISGYKSSGSAGGAYTCRWICWGRRDYNKGKQGGKESNKDWHKREHKTNTDSQKQKEGSSPVFSLHSSALMSEVSSDPQPTQSSPV